MIRNLKALGLGLVVVFALGAVAASAALAQNGLLTSNGPVKLTGAPTGEKNDNSITAFGGVVTCPNAKYTGFKILSQKQTEEGKTHELLPNGSSSGTIVPHFGTCITKVGAIEFLSTVDMNGCDFELDVGATIEANKYKLKATEECPAANTIKITNFANATKHAENLPFCVEDITKKTDRGETFVATDTLNGSVDNTGTIENLEIQRESPTGSILCPKEETKTGIWHFDLNVTGDNSLGEKTTISLSHV
jgi:hypothetical protein